jgi:MFS transporter, OFA family, oxalate/formate antiporter
MTSRWRIAAAAVMTHVCLGSVYAWSIFVPSLQAQTGWSKPQLTWAFSLAIAFLGLTAALAAPLMKRLGPRCSVGLSAAFFGTGLLGAGLAIHLHVLWLLYVCYGGVGGIGLGLGYVPPVTTLMQWFANRKGFATGLAVGGFGLGALLASFLGEGLLRRFSCASTFPLMGFAYGLTILIASRNLSFPQLREDAKALDAAGSKTCLAESRFWLLWAVFFLNIATGILLIALARPMIEEAMAKGAGAISIPTVTAVAVMGLFNGFGRLGWSSLSDRLGRFTTWMAMFVLQGALFFLLKNTGSLWVLVAGLWLIASGYGGGFALCPALVADVFGPARAPRVYGMALTAWSAAALISPPLAAKIHETTGSYDIILRGCFFASLLGLVLVIALQQSLRSSMRDQELETDPA